MNGPTINLLPRSIREQLVVRRHRMTLWAVGLSTAAVIVAATAHAHVVRGTAAERLERLRTEASRVLSREAAIDQVREQIVVATQLQARYDRMAAPIELGQIIATVVSELPDGVSIERLELDAGLRRNARAMRATSGPRDGEAPPRRLRGTVMGFAPDDAGIAAFVQSLQDRDPIREVSLDFSRTRVVRDRTARGFLVSFEVDLDQRYDVQVVAAGEARP